MATSLLQKAYDPEIFKAEGQLLIDQLSVHLQQTLSSSTLVTVPKDPQAEFEFWQQKLDDSQTTQSFFQTVIDRSIHLHHPRYIGHQIAPPVPVSALAILLSALLNNGMAVYEMGQASSAIERVVIQWFVKHTGYQNGDGFLTSGGTLANLTALLAARKAKAPKDVWQEGHTNRLAILVSEEAHYCVDRAARIMGLGEAGIIKVPVNGQYQIRTDLLEPYYKQAIQDGLRPIAIIGSACSTSTGMYDDVEALSAFAKAYNLWFHVDGAHGGAAVFSSKYKHLVNGIAKADSIIIDGHKMMATPAVSTALLFKNGDASYQTFHQKAQYLWDTEEDKEWFNYGKRTFECTKSMMSLRFYSIMNAHGTQFFDDFVTSLYDLGQQFGQLVEEDRDFELFLKPQSNIVCFRHKHAISAVKNDETLTKKIRQQLFEEGKYYIVTTQLQEETWFRTTIMNPFTTKTHFIELLNYIRSLAKHIKT